MLRALPASASSRSRCLVPVTRRTRPQTTTVAVRYRQVHTPATPTTRTNEPNALPLSDAQRRTIYALSTPPGRSGVAIIRVSGPDVLGVWHRMVRPARTAAARRASAHHGLSDAHRHGKHSDETLTRQRHPEPQKLERCHVVDPQTAEHVDDALAVFFRGAYRPPSPSSLLLLLLLIPENSSSRVHSPPLVHDRGRLRTTRTRRTRRHQLSASRARAHPNVSPCRSGRVHAPRVRGWPARSHAG